MVDFVDGIRAAVETERALEKAAAVPEVDRRRFIGGSDIAAIMGVGATFKEADGRYVTQTPFTVWSKKTADRTEEMDPDKRRFLDRRKRWEGPIRQMLEEEFDAKIVGFNQRYVDPEVPFFASEIDFEWLDPETGKVENGEIKTVSPFAYGEKHGWGDPGTGDVPIHYAAQAMWGLGVKRRTRCMVAALVGLDDIVFYPIKADPATITTMREVASEFWTRFVVPRVPPAPQSGEDVRIQMLRKTGRPVELDAPTYERLTKLRQVRVLLETAALEEEGLLVDVGSYILKQWGQEDPLLVEDASLTVGGKVVATWKKQGGSHLDQKRLKVERPEIVREFTKAHQYRVLRFPKSK